MELYVKIALENLSNDDVKRIIPYVSYGINNALFLHLHRYVDDYYGMFPVMLL